MEHTSRTTVDGFLASARSRITRLTPHQALSAQNAGAIIIDTRCESDRASEGVVPGSTHIPLSTLLWRVDPAGELTDDSVNDLAQHLVLYCVDGYASSWAGATLKTLGFTTISDLEGGFTAWRDAGLPIETLP
jgi:rhodanese-related sulfurtransferase